MSTAPFETPILVEIERRLRARLDPVLALTIRDDSALHAGHAGAAGGGGHFHVRLQSPCFIGLSLVARHRAVYAALGDLMRDRIHALSLELVS
ncbi:MAG: BolA family protein [Leptothrix ochracea]|uniref:BolA family protein n=1 Tax=Leptothrix ochracea TaxID=735331 RepID=UPI0034E2DCEA